MAKLKFMYPRYNKLTITEDALGMDVETPAVAGAAIGKAIDTNISYTIKKVALYGDNKKDSELQETTGGTFTLNVNDITLEIEADILDKTITAGLVETGGDDAASYVRWGFVRGGMRGTAKYYRGIVFCKVKFGQGNETYKTKGESPTLDPDSLTGSFELNKDNKLKWEQQFITEPDAIAFINSYLNINMVLALTSAAGAAGKTMITVAPVKLTGSTYKYKTDVAVTLPVYGDALVDYTPWDGIVEITATSGNEIAIAEVNTAGKCIGVGKIVAVAGA